VAYISLKPGATPDMAQLSVFANARIPERPAYPKRISVLPAIPMTAIGKVYKPRLRALACQHVLLDRLEKTSLKDCVALEVEDAAHGLGIDFKILETGDPAPVAERIEKMMQQFAFDYKINGSNARKA
jgi:fatty-acyl-CoA synthase